MDVLVSLIPPSQSCRRILWSVVQRNSRICWDWWSIGTRNTKRWAQIPMKEPGYRELGQLLFGVWTLLSFPFSLPLLLPLVLQIWGNKWPGYVPMLAPTLSLPLQLETKRKGHSSTTAHIEHSSPGFDSASYCRQHPCWKKLFVWDNTKFDLIFLIWNDLFWRQHENLYGPSQ